MEGEGETSARVETKSGRKKKVRECELHPQQLWCSPCQNRRTKRPCEGPRITFSEPTLLDVPRSHSVDAHCEMPAAAPSASPLDVRRPVRTSAGIAPLRLEAEYPYAERHVRDNRASADVATRRPPSQKVKVSALQAAIAERNVKLEVIEGKLKALMRGPWYKALSQEESDWMGTVQVNDELIDIDRFAAWQLGSNVFVDTGEVVKVFIDDIRMTNVELKQIESRSRAGALFCVHFCLPSMPL